MTNVAGRGTAQISIIVELDRHLEIPGRSLPDRTGMGDISSRIHQDGPAWGSAQRAQIGVPLSEFDSLSTAGARLGRYTASREVAKGPLGPLVEVWTETDDTKLAGLARIVMLPAELTVTERQELVAAAQRSTRLVHDWVLCLADFVFEAQWMALVHDHVAGHALRNLQHLVEEQQTSFPPAVAVRVALDILAGLEPTRALCTSLGIAHQFGNVATTSLYLCLDGRTRAVDGQVPGTSLRTKALLAVPGAAAYAAPEVLDGRFESTERSDVFAVGVVLWELLTGQRLLEGPTEVVAERLRLELPSVSLALSGGTEVPAELIAAVHTALELDPQKRFASCREFAVTLQTAVPEVADYARVVEFIATLTQRETTEAALTAPSSLRLSARLAAERVGSNPPISASSAKPDPDEPSVLVGDPPSTEANPGSELKPGSGQGSSEAMVAPLPPPPEVAVLLARPAEFEPRPSPRIPSQPPPLVAPRPPAEEKDAAEVVVIRTKPVEGEGSSGTLPPVEPHRKKQITLSGVNPPPSVPPSATPSPSAAPPPAPAPVSSATPIPAAAPRDSVAPRDLVVPPDSAAPVVLTSSIPPAPLSVSRSVPPSAPAPALAIELGDELELGRPRRFVRLSMTTLILGFSTTVLAVVVIMMLAQGRSGSDSAAPPGSSTARTERALQSPDESTSLAASQSDADRLSAAGQKDAGAADANPAAGRRPTGRRSSRAGNYGPLPEPVPNEEPATPLRSSGSRKSRYVPSDL